MLLFAVAAPLAMAITRDEYKERVEPICKKNSRSERKDPQDRPQGSQGRQAEDGGGQIHQGLDRPEEDLQRTEGGRTADRRRGEADQVARLRQDRGRTVQQRRQGPQGRQQVEGAEVRQQAGVERQPGQRPGPCLRFPLLQVRTVQVHLRGPLRRLLTALALLGILALAQGCGGGSDSTETTVHRRDHHRRPGHRQRHRIRNRLRARRTPTATAPRTPTAAKAPPRAAAPRAPA